MARLPIQRIFAGVRDQEYGQFARAARAWHQENVDPVCRAGSVAALHYARETGCSASEGGANPRLLTTFGLM